MNEESVNVVFGSIRFAMNRIIFVTSILFISVQSSDGAVKCVREWPFSTFRHFVALGLFAWLGERYHTGDNEGWRAVARVGLIHKADDASLSALQLCRLRVDRKLDHWFEVFQWICLA